MRCNIVIAPAGQAGTDLSDLAAARDAPPFDWRAHLRVHPAAELFPPMAEAELKELAEDIKANGLRAPIVGWAPGEGQFVLDGRNRLDALALLGLLYETPDNHLGIKKWTGTKWANRSDDRIEGTDAWQNLYERDGDPYAIALSLNVHRRHLTNEKKRELIAKVLAADPEKSNRQIAEQVKADDKTVAKVRTELESTAEIPQLKQTTGKDGKARPAKAKKKPKPAKPVSPADDPQASAESRKQQYAADEREVNKNFEDDTFEPNEDIEEPRRVLKNVLDSLKQAKAVAEAYRKILKVSPFDRKAKKEISEAIDSLIRKWRSVQSTLAAKPPLSGPGGGSGLKVEPLADTVPEPAEATTRSAPQAKLTDSPQTPPN